MEAKLGALQRVIQPTRLMTILGRLLRSRRLPLILPLLSMLLALPALQAGWLLDDWQHRAALLGPRRIHGLDAGFFPSGRWTVLFRFFDGEPEHLHRAMERGLVPWWTLPELRASFFRPLSAGTHWLDYQVWPNSAWAMHLHSLLWLGLLVGAVAVGYRRFLGPTAVAGLAALAYAVDDSHGMPAGWIANRNALVAGVFGIAALLVHDRWRGGNWRAGAWLGPALFLLALLAGEAGVAALAYVAAYAVCLDRAPWRSRLLTLLPYAVVLVLWRLAALHYGAGVYGMDFYLDPGRDPGRFLQAIPRRVPLLLLGLWSPIPSDVGLFLDSGDFRVLWWISVAVVMAVVLLVAPLVRGCRVARFFALGMVLSLIPLCATFPSDRLLIFAGIGGMGLLGQFLAAVLKRDSSLPASRLWWVTAWAGAALLAATHLVLAPLHLPDQAAMTSLKNAQFSVSLPDNVSLANRSVVIMNGPLAFAAVQLPLLRAVQGVPVPRHTLVLFPSLAAMRITRRDARTLLLQPEGGYLSSQLDALYRGPQFRLVRGQRVVLADAALTVETITPDGRPNAVSCRFASPPEDGSRLWLCWREGRYQLAQPPGLGQSLSFPPAIPNW